VSQALGNGDFLRTLGPTERGTQVALPLDMVSTGTTARSSPSHDEVDEPVDIRGLRVLVVDDDPDARELLEVILTGAGASVQSAESVSRAFELLVSMQPQIIISDIDMPDENGYSFLRNLRSVLDEDGGKTPAIALTGHTQPDDRVRALKAGFNLHLSKPTTADEVLHAVRAVVQSK
jgi:two-component system OmpR family response regulator